jgi:hypothetical protein
LRWQKEKEKQRIGGGDERGATCYESCMADNFTSDVIATTRAAVAA